MSIIIAMSEVTESSSSVQKTACPRLLASRAASLRGDMTAMILPFRGEEHQVRIQAMAALLTLPRSDAHLVDAATRAGIGPWGEVNRGLLQRAMIAASSLLSNELDTLAEVIPMSSVVRAVQELPITREFQPGPDRRRDPARPARRPLTQAAPAIRANGPTTSPASDPVREHSLRTRLAPC